VSNNGFDMTDLRNGAKAPRFDFARYREEAGGGDAASGLPAVVFFYPRIGSPACTSEVLDFARLRPNFDALGVLVVGVSPDTERKIDAFRTKHGIALSLVSDEDLKIVKRWGMWVEKSMYGRAFMGVERATFLVNAKGKIAQCWRKVRVKGHAEAVLEAARSLVTR
jgi:thioredoxin-dependent peroxiredoxin